MINTKKILDHFKKVDPIIYQEIKVIDFSAWIKPSAPNTYLKRLCREIISQQLSDKASAPIYKRFQKLFMKQRFSPNSILKKTDKQLRATGMSWSTAGYIK